MRVAPLAILLALFSQLSWAGDKEIAYLSADLDKDGKPDSVLVLEEGTEADPDQLNFVVQFGNGIKLQNNKLVRKSGLNESSGLSLKLLANGSVLVRSVKDWGTSNWVSDIYLSFREGKLKISGFDHEWYYRERGGKCEFNLLSSIATINKKKIQMPKEDMAFGPDANLGGYLDFCLEQTSSK